MKLAKPIAAACLAAGMLAAVPAAAEAPVPPPAAPALRMGTMPQEFYMAKIMVSDLWKSYDFYTRIVGLKPITGSDIPMPQLPKRGDPEKDFFEIALNYSGSMADPMFLLFTRRGQAPTPEKAAVVSLGFKVPDVAAVMDRASKAGYPASRPFDPARPIGFIKDPDGYAVEFIQAPSFPR